MKTPQKTTYYLITERIGDLTKEGTPTTSAIRGLYSTQAKALAELFSIASHNERDGTIIVPAYNIAYNLSLSEIIHAHTINGETIILGYNSMKKQLIELQIKPITLDIPTLITT